MSLVRWRGLGLKYAGLAHSKILFITTTDTRTNGRTDVRTDRSRRTDGTDGQRTTATTTATTVTMDGRDVRTENTFTSHVRIIQFEEFVQPIEQHILTPQNSHVCISLKLRTYQQTTMHLIKKHRFFLSFSISIVHPSNWTRVTSIQRANCSASHAHLLVTIGHAIRNSFVGPVIYPLVSSYIYSSNNLRWCIFLAHGIIQLRSHNQIYLVIKACVHSFMESSIQSLFISTSSHAHLFIMHSFINCSLVELLNCSCLCVVYCVFHFTLLLNMRFLFRWLLYLSARICHCFSTLQKTQFFVQNHGSIHFVLG